jgi:phosphate transport system permease protein
MVIGNTARISLSLFAPQYTMAAVIANEFSEATEDLHVHALVEIGMVLFIVTLFVNVLSRGLIWRMNRQPKPRTKAVPAVAATAGGPA